MDCLKVLPETLEVLQRHKVEREKLIYGHVDPPIMVECDYKDGRWGEPKLVPYHSLSLDPSSKVLHYAQGIFEGMKAYYVDKRGPFIFRPEDNYKRLLSSSNRLDIPELPKEIFMDSIHGFVRHSTKYIPEETNHSLYLRPFIIATEVGLGARTATEFKFIVIGKYSKPYFSGEDGVPVYLERHYSRVGAGCTGAAKAISNYASGLKVDREARENGYNITLWLDASEGRYIEELSGMNFFCVLGETIITPALNDSILPGITRDSVITLARDMGYSVKEIDIEINELLSLNAEECNEMFCCGTTATVMPIRHLGEKDGSMFVPRYGCGPITSKLKEALLAIQEGRAKDPYGWVNKV